ALGVQTVALPISVPPLFLCLSSSISLSLSPFSCLSLSSPPALSPSLSLPPSLPFPLSFNHTHTHTHTLSLFSHILCPNVSDMMDHLAYEVFVPDWLAACLH